VLTHPSLPPTSLLPILFQEPAAKAALVAAFLDD
jgi:hypothetical protein